jgi:hypothetical protein
VHAIDLANQPDYLNYEANKRRAITTRMISFVPSRI